MKRRFPAVLTSFLIIPTLTIAYAPPATGNPQAGSQASQTLEKRPQALVVRVGSISQDIKREVNTITISQSYQDRLLGEGFMEVLQGARATPVTEGSKVVGFRLTKIKRGSVYDRAGLEDGDVIASINGQSLAEADQLAALLQSLQAKQARNEQSKPDQRKNL